MASQVQICNMALANVGISRQIANIDENSNEAIQCKTFYDQAVLEMLRDFPWPFARKFQALALVEEADDQPWAGEWTYAYRYPSDCAKALRIALPSRRSNETIIVEQTAVQRARRQFDPSPAPFDVGHDSAGKLIFTDETDAILEYTENVTDPGKFDPDFAHALSWKIAIHVALPLSVSHRIRSEAAQFYLFALSNAQSRAANETQRKEEPDSGFIRARW